jgi:hypothetical protein
MGAHSDFIGFSFRILGVLVGAPATLVFLVAVLLLLRGALSPSPTLSASGGDPLVDTLLAFPRALGWLAQGINKFGTFLLSVAAFLGFAGATLGTGLFFTGRGISAGSGWARGLGMTLSAGILLIGLLAALSFRKNIAGGLAAALACAAAYLLWALARRA